MDALSRMELLLDLVELVNGLNTLMVIPCVGNARDLSLTAAVDRESK